MQTLELFDDWTQKYEYIIELGQQLPALDEQFKKMSLKLKAARAVCGSMPMKKRWFAFFEADSDSVFKGEIAYSLKCFSGRKPEEILAAELKFIDAMGLRQHIAVTRANGLASMIKLN